MYLAGRGVTTNEAFKWEQIEDAIDRGEIWVEEPVQATGKDAKKHKPSTRKRQVESLEELENIYDKGFFQNLYNILFPPSLIDGKAKQI